MGDKKKTKEYVPEALEYFMKCLIMVRQQNHDGKDEVEHELNIKGLQKAVQALPKENRQVVEKFWGLTGGPNHSKKLININQKDVAFLEMRNKAILALRKLLTIDYVIIYDDNLHSLINKVVRKVNKSGLNISDIEIVKLIMAFSIYVQNGPKMCFEDELMSIDMSIDASFLFDEYEVLKQMLQEIEKFPDNSINLELLISFFEMIDIQDMLVIKNSMGIEITGVDTKNIETVRSVSKIREFKERMFARGAWEVTDFLISGNSEGKVKIDSFKEALSHENVRDWVEKIETFKTTETKELRTSKGIVSLPIYRIGGLEFTDPQEIDFLYLYGELVEN